MLAALLAAFTEFRLVYLVCGLCLLLLLLLLALPLLLLLCFWSVSFVFPYAVEFFLLFSMFIHSAEGGRDAVAFRCRRRWSSVLYVVVFFFFFRVNGLVSRLVILDYGYCCALAPHDAEMIWLLSRAKPLGVRAVRCCWVLLIVAVRRWI